jgi:transposase
MSKYFRPWNIDQTLLLPPNVQDFVPKGHVSRFIVELVRESLDLKEITGRYVSGLGQPPFDPRMMVALLLHGYPNDHFGIVALYDQLERPLAAAASSVEKANPSIGQ